MVCKKKKKTENPFRSVAVARSDKKACLPFDRVNKIKQYSFTCTFVSSFRYSGDKTVGAVAIAGWKWKLELGTHTQKVAPGVRVALTNLEQTNVTMTDYLAQTINIRSFDGSTCMRECLCLPTPGSARIPQSVQDDDGWSWRPRGLIIMARKILLCLCKYCAKPMRNDVYERAGQIINIFSVICIVIYFQPHLSSMFALEN